MGESGQDGFGYGTVYFVVVVFVVDVVEPSSNCALEAASKESFFSFSAGFILLIIMYGVAN